MDPNAERVCENCSCDWRGAPECPVCDHVTPEEPARRRKIVYRLSVYATMPLSDDPDDADYPTLEGAADAKYKRAIERAAFECLKRMEQDCDVELMDFTVEDE